MTSDFWNEDREATLRECVGRGLSGRAIGVVLGCSKNRVYGKAKRLGLTLDGVTLKSAPPVTEFDAAPVDGVPIWELRDTHCRAILNDPMNTETLRYCGEPTALESSWCKEHHGRYMTTTAAVRAARLGRWS